MVFAPPAEKPLGAVTTSLVLEAPTVIFNVLPASETLLAVKSPAPAAPASRVEPEFNVTGPTVPAPPNPELAATLTLRAPFTFASERVPLVTEIEPEPVTCPGTVEASERR